MNVGLTYQALIPFGFTVFCRKTKLVLIKRHNSGSECTHQTAVSHTSPHTGAAWTLTRMGWQQWALAHSDKQAPARGDPVCSTRHRQKEEFLILLCPQGLSGQGGLTPTPKKTSKDQKERECVGPSNHHFLPDTFVKYYPRQETLLF